MALVRQEPWSLMARLHDEINRTYQDWSGGDTSSATADWVPAADVEEYADRFELFVDLPGVSAKDVEITTKVLERFCEMAADEHGITDIHELIELQMNGGCMHSVWCVQASPYRLGKHVHVRK